MTVTHKTDYRTEATTELLTSEMRAASRVVAIVGAFADQVQDLEDDVYAMIVERTIDTAVGVQLDQVGAIVGQDRWGRSDDDYRDLIRARVLANASRGLPETMIGIASAIIGETITYSSYGTAHFQLEWTIAGTSSASTEAAVATLVLAGQPSGVSGSLVEVDSTVTPAFAWGSGGSGWGADALATRRMISG